MEELYRMVPSQETVYNLLAKAGFPDFPLDKRGFPSPGVVVRHFRERMTYVDPGDQKEKNWTQMDLAKRLGVSEVTIRLMEKQNKGLDSMERRRLLADILHIPPALLGLGSLFDLMEFLSHHQGATKALVSAPTPVKGNSVDNKTIQLYQDAFLVYSDMHSTSTAQDALFEIEQWIERITSDLTIAQLSQRPLLQRTLWDFHSLSAKIYSDDLCNWVKSFDHLNASLQLADVLNNNDLRAASLYRSGQIRFAQRNFTLAKSDLDGAVTYAKNGSPIIKGAVFAAAGLAHALVNKDIADVTYAQRLLDQAETCAAQANTTDEFIIKFSIGKYLLERSDALIALGRPAKALELLDDAEIGLDPTQRRRIAYLNILRADAYMKLKRPEFDSALLLLEDSFAVSTAIKSEYNIAYIERLYKILGASNYGSSPAVADLGISLREWRSL
jgi:transcriptional regulator with XRE-family HTH domain